MDKVPVIIAKDLTEEQVRAFRLADNRVASFSSWDEAKLKEEIAEINNIDLSDFGFKKDKIDDIFREKAEIKTHICPKCGHEWSD
jgi:site-specific DNA-methyltransferase (adenine-specific)